MKTKTELLPALKKRWSPRSFSSTRIPNDDLALMMEAARWAPSSFNEQPWRFIITHRGDESYQQLLETLSRSNQEWAQSAPVLMAAISKVHFDRNGRPNKHHRYDLGQAVAHLTVQATDRGYYVHQMAGFNAKEVEQHFQIPDDFEAVTVVAIGPLADGQSMPENRSRKPITDIVFEGGWEQSLNV
ncbi:MAG: nitroreductase family protein [Bacteroidota bacterium]